MKVISLREVDLMKEYNVLLQRMEKGEKWVQPYEVGSKEFAKGFKLMLELEARATEILNELDRVGYKISNYQVCYGFKEGEDF